VKTTKPDGGFEGSVPYGGFHWTKVSAASSAAVAAAATTVATVALATVVAAAVAVSPHVVSSSSSISPSFSPRRGEDDDTGDGGSFSDTQTETDSLDGRDDAEAEPSLRFASAAEAAEAAKKAMLVDIWKQRAFGAR